MLAVFAAVASTAIGQDAGNRPAAAEPIVQTLAGSWGGAGRITYTDGTSESLRCNAYYSGSGNELGMTIQCKSEKNNIHMRCKLRIDGARASGEWEERTFNASGSASGRVGAGSLTLSVAGGGFSGRMTVAFSKGSQTVDLSTEGIAMKRANMNFNRR